jgi:hypothetical protein
MFEAGYKFSDGIPLIKFQWGYFLLWALFWFLVVALHWQYLINGLREVWFYVKRFHRYGASVLTGFRETAQAARQRPVTGAYPRGEVTLPQTYHGVPRLNVATLTADQAAEIIAADASGAITAAPDQPTVLFLDLGRFVYSPALANLTDEHGTPLLGFGDCWAEPGLGRTDLVIPLGAARGVEPAGEILAEAAEAQAVSEPLPDDQREDHDEPGGAQ